MKYFIILAIIVTIIASLLAADQYYLSLQDQEIKKSDWVQNCVPPESHQVVPSIGLFNHTHSFDLLTCTWTPTEYGTPGFLESLYISFIESIILDIADNFEIKYAFADCNADVNYDVVLKNSELAFTGTVTRLDNYDGPQRVTFFVHDVIKGQVDIPKHILENTGKIFHEDGSVTSSSIAVDYKIGKTYKVYVENGHTTICTTKLTSPPAGYMWEPGPEDGNYYSDENDDGPEPEPEPEQDRQIPVNCGPGTTLQDGICVVNSENTDTTNGDKWGDAYNEKQIPPPRLEPIRDYDYGFIYVIVLLTVVIIGGVTGIVFVIRRKRK